MGERRSAITQLIDGIPPQSHCTIAAFLSASRGVRSRTMVFFGIDLYIALVVL